MADITNPHDKFFREVWSRKEIAVDFLANYLPEDVSKHLKLDTLEIQKDSFIEEDLKEQFSDVLYRLEFAGGDEGFVYVLFEHKSYPDHYVTVQLLRYMGAIWQQYLKNRSKHDREQSPGIPLIVPLVFYHGAEDWYPRSLGDLVENVPDSFRPYIPDFNFAFSNFAASVAPEIRGEALLQAILRLLHTMPGGDLRNELNQIMVLLKGIADDPTGKSIFRTMIEYIYAAQDEVTPEDVGRTARTELSSKEETEIMTIAEQLEKRGHKKGECTILQRLLKNRFGDIPEQYRKRVEQADSDTLLKWTDRVLTAHSIDEVFEDK